MADVIQALPEGARATVIRVLEEADQPLLAALRDQEEPTREQREQVEDVLSDVLCEHVGDNSELTEFGRAIDDALGKFLLRWPIEH